MVGEQTQEGICKEAARAPVRVLLLVLRLVFFFFLLSGARCCLVEDATGLRAEPSALCEPEIRNHDYVVHGGKGSFLLHGAPLWVWEMVSLIYLLSHSKHGVLMDSVLGS